ncbi:MAG: tetratricopeptide repeat protein [Desulfobacterales bacterium]|nr:tetratricopeptide repeat protein [Desulfobacterales bacterium]
MNRNGLFSKLSPTREFLFSKSTPEHPGEGAPEKSMETGVAPAPPLPDALSGDAFIQHAMALVDASPTFGAMVMRVDAPGEKSAGESIHPVVTLAGVVDEACREEEGAWGVLGPDLLGCFFPDRTRSHCLRTAEKIKAMLAAIRKSAVTMGLAFYPTDRYKKEQILDNAVKALDHAGFLGAGGMVQFDSVSLNISGDKRYDAGDIPGAIEEFEAALALDPENVNVYNSLGVCRGVLGEFDEALKSFNAAISLDPTEIMAIYNTGLIYLYTGDKEKALDHFLKADAMGGDVFEVIFQIGRVHLEMGNLDKARQRLEDAARLRPDSGPVHRFLGDCYQELEMRDKATAAYENAIKFNGNDAHALSALGRLYDLHNINTEIATIFCRQSVEIAPANGLFHYRLGRLYKKRNMMAEALEALETAKRLGQGEAEPLIEEIHAQMGKEKVQGSGFAVIFRP